jgi:hypothetical protein
VAAAVANMAYTVKAMPSERLRQLVADDYCRHRHAVGGHVYTGVSTYDQYNAYIHTPKRRRQLCTVALALAYLMLPNVRRA